MQEIGPGLAFRRGLRHRHGPMFRLRTAFALLLAAALAGCAAPQLSATRDAMPAARAGLRPEYRIFYDALQDYGDWVLIEPYGFVFRPSVNVAQWRPYMDGFWAPSDLYGWVWISAEPFGWATYHYGRWMYDPYQRWVWIPGADWAPAWVSWEQSGDYVGWSPLMASGGTNPPGGAYTWAPMGQLGGTNLRANTASTAQLGEAVAHPEPVSNPDTAAPRAHRRPGARRAGLACRPSHDAERRDDRAEVRFRNRRADQARGGAERARGLDRGAEPRAAAGARGPGAADRRVGARAAPGQPARHHALTRGA